MGGRGRAVGSGSGVTDQARQPLSLSDPNLTPFPEKSPRTFPLSPALFLEVSSLVAITETRGVGGVGAGEVGNAQAWGSTCIWFYLQLPSQDPVMSLPCQYYCKTNIPARSKGQELTVQGTAGEEIEVSSNCPLKIMPAPLGCCFLSNRDPNSSCFSWVFLTVSPSVFLIPDLHLTASAEGVSREGTSSLGEFLPHQDFLARVFTWTQLDVVHSSRQPKREQ